MTVKCYYRKNLNMSPPKLAAQVGHAVTNLILKSIDGAPHKIIVLEARDGKFRNIKKDLEQNSIVFHVQVDLGFTEVPEGTETVIAYFEGE